MTMFVSYEDLAGEIVSRCASGRVNLIAIDGPSGSGKSTIARAIAALMNDAPIIETDDFLSFNDLATWWPRFEKQVLEPLAAGSPAHYQCRDWENDFLGDSLGTWKTVQRAPIMFIEGVASSRLALANQLTMSIWVEAPRELRLARGVERDGEHRRPQWMQFMHDEDEWFASDNTRWRAELMLDGDPPPELDQTKFVALLES